MRDNSEYIEGLIKETSLGEQQAEKYSVGYYEGEQERQTLDGEWVESELLGDISDICIKILKKEAPKYENRALKDKLLLSPEYLATQVCENIPDVIELYNSEYDKRKSEKLFGIHYFDEAIEKEVRSILKNNVVS